MALPHRAPTSIPALDRRLTGLWISVLCVSLLMVFRSCMTLDGYEPVMPEWRSVEGTIVETEIFEWGVPNPRPFLARVRYEYPGPKGTLSSTQLTSRPAVRFETREQAESWLRTLPVGMRVTVHYRAGLEEFPVLSRDPKGQEGRSGLRFSAGEVGVAIAVLGLTHQARRNAHRKARIRRRPPPDRQPRPMRSAGKGEVRRGRGFRKTLGRMLGRVPHYREFPKKLP